MIRVLEVKVEEHFASALALIRANWEETGFDFPCDPQVEMYVQARAAGMFFSVAAFDEDVPVGYSNAFIVPHHFNPAVILCSSSSLFVRKDHRDGVTGAWLIRETERIAKERGASRMTWNTRAGTPFAALLEKRGYVPADLVVMKGL